MNKDPELNYYALKLAISLKGDDGDTFTKVYDEICKSASLTDEQINWIKDKIRELQQSQSDTLLQTRLNWYEGILKKNKEETTTEENTNHKEYEKSLTHLRSVMHSIVDNQPSMKSFTPPSTSLSCAQQSLNTVSSTDINKNFDGPHISKPPMITPVQKQDFFSGFDDIDSNGTEMTDMKNKNATYVDVDEGVNFPLLGGPQKHRDYSTIKIDSDHGSELVDWKSIANGEAETANDNQNKKRKKKKRKNGSNDGSEIGSNGTNENGIETGPEPMEIDGEIKTKKSRSQRRSEQKKKLEEKKIKDQELSERGQLESALGLSKKAVTPVQNVPIIYPEKRKKRTIKEFRAEKERNQRTFYNLKAGNIVLVQNPRSLTPMIGNITTGQSQTELLKQQREQLAQEKAKEWKIPQWVEDEERERRKKKLKSKNRKIEETKNQKTKKLPEAQEEIKNETYTEQEDPVVETEKESTITTTGQAEVQTVGPITVPDSVPDIDGDDWTCFSKKKEKKSKPPTGNEITKSVQSPIKSHLPVQTTIEPEIHVQDEVWPELISEMPKNQAPISRLPIRTPSPPQKENPETESETDPPTPDKEKHQTPPDQSESDHDDIEPEVSIDEPEVTTHVKPEVSTFQSVTNNLMGLNFMMESCEIGEVDQSPVELDKNIRVEGNLNFLVESNIEQEVDVSRRLPMSNVTNLEDIEGDQHVIKPSEHYPYHTDTVKFLESSYKAVLNRLKNGSAKNYEA